MIYNTCIFVSIAIYGDSDHATDITIKNGSRLYITLAYLPVLLYMVTPTTKWTSTESKVPLHSMHMESTGTPLGVSGIVGTEVELPRDLWGEI